MKKFFYTLLASLVLAVSATAATKTVVFTSTSTTNLAIPTNSMIITAIRISGVAGSVGFALFDWQNASLQYTNGSWTNYVSTYQSCTNTWVDILGNTNSTVYNCVTNVATVVNAATNLPPLITYAVGATNSTVSLGSAETPFIATRGLMITNTGAGTISIDYYPLR